MHTRTLWPALLLVAAAACSADGIGPVDTPWARAFDIAVPSLRQLSSARPTDTPPSPPDSIAASVSYDDGDLPPGYAELLASGSLMAHRPEADAGFHGDHEAAFGQALGTSRGSFYRNAVDLKLSYRGSQIGQTSGEESQSCLCAHIWSPWGRTASATIGIGSECGHHVHASARHEARLEISVMGKTWTLLADAGTATAQASQPPCGVAGSGSGGGSGLDEEQWYICYWEDYYDANGDFVRRVELGCQQLNMS